VHERNPREDSSYGCRPLQLLYIIYIINYSRMYNDVRTDDILYTGWFNIYVHSFFFNKSVIQSLNFKDNTCKFLTFFVLLKKCSTESQISVFYLSLINCLLLYLVDKIIFRLVIIVDNLKKKEWFSFEKQKFVSRITR